MTKWWWKRAPKPAPALIAIVLTTAALSAVAPRAHAQDASAPADTTAPPTLAPTTPAPAAVAPAAAPAAPAVDPKAAKKADEQRRKDIAAKEKADRQAKALAEAEEARKSGIPWFKGADWMSFRVGISGSKVDNSPDAGAAVGFAAQHFTSAHTALGLNADLDVLGKFNAATEMELPLTLEAQRHVRWGTDTFRPFIGVGTGIWYHRYYRTGEDGTSVRPGFFVSGGFNSPISGTGVIGMMFRATVQSDAETDNPYFANDSNSAVHWSLKLNYSRIR